MASSGGERQDECESSPSHTYLEVVDQVQERPVEEALAPKGGQGLGQPAQPACRTANEAGKQTRDRGFGARSRTPDNVGVWWRQPTPSATRTASPALGEDIVAVGGDPRRPRGFWPLDACVRSSNVWMHVRAYVRACVHSQREQERRPENKNKETRPPAIRQQ